MCYEKYLDTNNSNLAHFVPHCVILVCVNTFWFFLVSVYRFQENLIRTMMQIEETFFDLAASCPQNCLVICDRGIMDASACKISY